MKNILITGGSGFIGTFLRDIESQKVINYDILPPTIETNAQFIEGDIFDVDKLKAAEGTDTVFHLAATHFDFQSNYHKTNVNGTTAVIEAMEKADVKKIAVFLSSVAVYGRIVKPTSEDDSPAQICHTVNLN